MKGTMAQKILARASGKGEVKPGEYVMANVDMAMCNDQMADIQRILDDCGVKKPWNTDKVVIFIDHQIPASSVARAETHQAIRESVRKLGVKYFYDGIGISHQLMVEKGHVVPGELITGSDSHTTTYGALGAASTGIGITEAAYVLATGKLWFRVPETIKVNVHGKLQPRVMSKDIILHLAGKYTMEVAAYKAIEYCGPAVEELSLSSRMCISNMSVEIGAKFAFFTPDKKVTDYLKTRTNRHYSIVKADPDAVYEHVYDIDASQLEPHVAEPFTVDKVKPISKLGNVKIQQAVLGSCTNGRLEDLQIAAEVVRGKKVHPGTRWLVIPASVEIYGQALKDGTMQILSDAGATICNANCGPCPGTHMGMLASGEVCVASFNRNFKGRMGSPEAMVYLASPATVAASAIAGKIVDPRN
jgi:3-isopropylmalate/(R)-2-methylmalate dehydratase large subunit